MLCSPELIQQQIITVIFKIPAYHAILQVADFSDSIADCYYFTWNKQATQWTHKVLFLRECNQRSQIWNLEPEFVGFSSCPVSKYKNIWVSKTPRKFAFDFCCFKEINVKKPEPFYTCGKDHMLLEISAWPL
jgi:hypothetical protein